ncbi:unnamed protein product (macronuclear) [Paramecium tetraurelia]|uniref:Uncharacterized protein n=1 Tax=Paramecium tetraurelia TaxID=5888 RepID=A0BPU0_PARTE|nr:uncharacterized protein GSPATT00005307001 [Paramecium tetraurelia]CAK60557.1 unnamed protein product [Paramecium tetraurelia]|eukprot:XP_001427955.1 hypothetical protein (macronuclear) [Paramecium tetraurelia strain d4-2]
MSVFRYRLWMIQSQELGALNGFSKMYHECERASIQYGQVENAEVITWTKSQVNQSFQQLSITLNNYYRIILIIRIDDFVQRHLEYKIQKQLKYFKLLQRSQYFGFTLLNYIRLHQSYAQLHFQRIQFSHHMQHYQTKS